MSNIVGLKNKSVKVNIGTETIDGTTNDNGIFTGTKTLSSPGTITTSALFDGDEDYGAVSSESITVNVKYRTTLALTGNINVLTTDKNTYDIVLKHGGSTDESLETLDGKTVKVLIDGALAYTLTTSEGGHASFQHQFTAEAHTIKVMFEEDEENWECVSNELTVNVAKGSTSLEFTVDKTKVIVGDDLTFTATLKGAAKE